MRNVAVLGAVVLAACGGADGGYCVSETSYDLNGMTVREVQTLDPVNRVVDHHREAFDADGLQLEDVQESYVYDGDRLAFDLQAHYLPHDLANRGVNDPAALPDYPYRDDALLVWEAIRDWVHQYVHVYYTAEADVPTDTELQAWRTALVNDGSLQGVPELNGREALIDLLTMALFTASAQHAAVNFPQKPLMSYAPAVTGAGWAPAPTAQQGHHKADFLGMLPPLSLALEQLDVLSLLGSIHYRALGDYRSNDFPYRAWFRDPAIVDNALPRFQAALAVVEATIDARNAQRRREYHTLLPSRIPTSINI